MRNRKLRSRPRLWHALMIGGIALLNFPWIITAIPRWLGYAPSYALGLSRMQVLYGGIALSALYTGLLLFFMFQTPDKSKKQKLSYVVVCSIMLIEACLGFHGLAAQLSDHKLLHLSLESVVKCAGMASILLSIPTWFRSYSASIHASNISPAPVEA